MKKIMLLFIAGPLIIASCHKKAVPAITERKEFPEPPKPGQAMADPGTPEFIAAGKILYEGKCNRCHDLRAPDVYSPERWTSILKLMIPRARISDDQGKQVTAYVMANAKK
jgi:cytochrome c5